MTPDGAALVRGDLKYNPFGVATDPGGIVDLAMGGTQSVEPIAPFGVAGVGGGKRL